jgi:hypothetical protein
MPPHPPPCAANESLWGSMCYPSPNTIRVIPLGDYYSFVLGNVSPDLLPLLSNFVGDAAHMLVKNVRPNVDVTITSVSQEEAVELPKQLRPNDPNAKLPS